MNGKAPWPSPPNAAKKAHEKYTHRAINGRNHALIGFKQTPLSSKQPSRPAALKIEMGRHSKTPSGYLRKRKTRTKRGQEKRRAVRAEGRIWKIEKK